MMPTVHTAATGMTHNMIMNARNPAYGNVSPEAIHDALKTIITEILQVNTELQDVKYVTSLYSTDTVLT